MRATVGLLGPVGIRTTANSPATSNSSCKFPYANHGDCANTPVADIV
eukprot:COSAG02_NODE_38611_length_427_cov_0.780488_1_plen_46_part_10